jgi:hypothetical protein
VISSAETFPAFSNSCKAKTFVISLMPVVCSGIAVDRCVTIRESRVARLAETISFQVAGIMG